MNKTKKTSQQKGQLFENITKDFFSWFFNELGYTITKERIQFSGNQFGFDVQFKLNEEYNNKTIFIECKNYENDLDIGNIFTKILQVDLKYKTTKNDLFIGINSKSKFKNPYNESLENHLKNMFNFDVKLLDIDNKIKDLFALKPEFYKELYNEEAPTNINKDEIIDRFKHILFSTRALKKIILNDNDKSEFIGNIKLEDCYEERYLIKKSNDELNYLFEDKKTLFEILNQTNKIILLGNPGIGKTTELINLALKLWKIGEVESKIPVFKNLKDFTISDKIENYLPNRWNEIYQPILILDGLDEIKDIMDFTSKINTFIQNNKEINPKIILSCRTNIYYNQLITLDDFKSYYLDDLTFEQSKSILRNNFKIPINNYCLTSSHLDYLKTPFFLNLFADYIKENKNLPDSKGIMWESYISSQLKLHYEKIKRLPDYKSDIEIKPLTKLALINEFRHQNYIEFMNLCNIQDVVIDNFVTLPLIHNFDENYSFTHRQIQEYLVAKALSSKSFNVIIENTKIPSLDKIYPSLYNAISFLIDLMEDSKKKNQLIDWIVKKEVEILFSADKNRITEGIRNKVFQAFFTKHCIDKKYWISTNNPFSIKELGEFGSTTENSNFLITQIKNNEHFRIVISAIELLTHFTNIKKENLKKLYLSLLEDSEYDKNIYPYIIRAIKELNIHLVEEVLEIFRNNTNKELNTAILELITNYNEVDKYFNYIKEQFLFGINVVKREEKDEVLRLTSYYIVDLLLKFKNSDNFIGIITYYFDTEYYSRGLDHHHDEIIKRCLFFDNQDDDFVINLLQKIDLKSYYLRINEQLFQLVAKSINKIKIIKFLLSKFNFDKLNYEISTLIIEDNDLEFLINYFIDNNININEIQYFRNYLLSQGKRELALNFEEKLKTQQIIDKNFETIEEIEKRNLLINEKPQTNFDILFEKENLLSQIKKIFERYGEPIIESIYIQKISSDWYLENNNNMHIDMAYQVLSEILYKYKSNITFFDVESYLENNDIIVTVIKSKLNSKDKISVSETQKDFIKKWVDENYIKLNFNDIMVCDNYSSFSSSNDYLNWEKIIFFLRRLELETEELFLLNSLKVYTNSSSFDDSSFFENLIEKINNPEAIKRQIIENLKEEFLFSPILSHHINYALNHYYIEAYSDIERHLQSDLIEYNIKELFNIYFEIVKDVNFMKNCVKDLDSYKSWDIISILHENNIEINFCITKTKQYLETKTFDSNRTGFLKNCFNILFKNNKPEALEYYIKLNKIADLYDVDFYKYEYIDDYSKLSDIFDFTYNNDVDRTFYRSSEFFKSYIINLSKNQESYQLVRVELLKMKEKYKDDDNKSFIINLHLDEAEKSYYNAMSIPLSFEEALIKANQLTS